MQIKKKFVKGQNHFNKIILMWTYETVLKKFVHDTCAKNGEKLACF